MSPDDAGATQIGATLRDARRRYGMEVREVEERTKIRARYIRALENEDWETLPAPAYVRGFLRTYGQLLGLDGEMLADEFRRRHGEGTAPSGGSPSEPLLSEPRKPGERPPSRRLPLVVGVLLGIVVLLLLLSLIGGDGEEDGASRGQNREARQGQGSQQGGNGGQGSNGRNGGGGGDRNSGGKLREEDTRLVALSTVQVCLIGGGGETLIDNQVLGAQAEEEFTGSKRYRLTIGPGSVRFLVGDNRRRLEVSEPSSFEGDSKGIRDIEYRGPECP